MRTTLPEASLDLSLSSWNKFRSVPHIAISGTRRDSEVVTGCKAFKDGRRFSIARRVIRQPTLPRSCIFLVINRSGERKFRHPRLHRQRNEGHRAGLFDRLPASWIDGSAPDSA